MLGNGTIVYIIPAAVNLALIQIQSFPVGPKGNDYLSTTANLPLKDAHCSSCNLSHDQDDAQTFAVKTHTGDMRVSGSTAAYSDAMIEHLHTCESFLVNVE